MQYVVKLNNMFKYLNVIFIRYTTCVPTILSIDHYPTPAHIGLSIFLSTNQIRKNLKRLRPYALQSLAPQWL